MRKYLGIPYKDHGRTKEGLDCWGLCCIVSSEQYGKELPLLLGKYTSASHGDNVSELVELEKLKDWVKVLDYEAGDIVVFRVGGFPCHVGTYIGEGKFIHILSGSEVTIESLDSITWSNRLDGVYRRCKTQ